MPTKSKSRSNQKPGRTKKSAKKPTTKKSSVAKKSTGRTVKSKLAKKSVSKKTMPKKAVQKKAAPKKAMAKNKPFKKSIAKKSIAKKSAVTKKIIQKTALKNKNIPVASGLKSKKTPEKKPKSFVAAAREDQKVSEENIRPAGMPFDEQPATEASASAASASALSGETNINAAAQHSFNPPQTHQAVFVPPTSNGSDYHSKLKAGNKKKGGIKPSGKKPLS